VRLATIRDGAGTSVAVVRGDVVVPLDPGDAGYASIRAICTGGGTSLERIATWADAAPDAARRSLDEVEFAPAVPDPGAIYTIGLNYRDPSRPEEPGPARPLVYGKAASSVTGHRSVVTWDRSLTANVDGECELGVVIGAEAFAIEPDEAMDVVFGYTCINDISSRDPWLDGDQWLLGKSMPGFCPTGPWIVTCDELDVRDLRLGMTINGVAVQDGRTTQMRFRVADVITYLSRHVRLRPGDLIATGTPARLEGPLGPDRHLEPGDVVSARIEGIGELTTTIG
jgi:2-keto-4-pentenoate hydratase/2-oxohepta-3-ene-1,7-dioic acid hydratase in catechol pathway